MRLLFISYCVRFFRIIQSLTTMWFIAERDILIVHYLANTSGRFEMH